MNILTLHELCRQELPHLLDMRYMPHGWNRDGDRKARLKHSEAERYLTKALLTAADRLVARPVQERLTELFKLAAQERTIASMVEKMVNLLQDLPQLDQQEAYAAAELKDQLLKLLHVHGQLDLARESVRKKVGDAAAIGVPVDALLEHFDKTLKELLEKQLELETTLQSLESGMP